MTKKTRNILLGMIIFFAAAFIASGILKNLDSPGQNNSVRAVTKSEMLIRINGTSIPSYGLGTAMEYIAAEDLQRFNFKISYDEIPVKITMLEDVTSIQTLLLSDIKNNTKAEACEVLFNGTRAIGYRTDSNLLIPLELISDNETASYSKSGNIIDITLNSADNTDTSEQYTAVTITPTPIPDATSAPVQNSSGKIIVLDPGHGLSSGAMDSASMEASGWVYNESKGQWGEWRHWKSGSNSEDCNGYGCSGRVTSNGSCWYSIGAGDRTTEPDLNLQNALAAKKYLEANGYTVRMTRETNNENPSITKRIDLCYPNGNRNAAPDALAYICIHSNAGGGRGSSYIELEGNYDQKNIPADYVERSNALGKAINDQIVNQTSLGAFSGGCYEGSPQLILFCKSPVICGYMEIGFFDDSSDLSILRSESDAIGKAIADGIIEFFGD